MSTVRIQVRRGTSSEWTTANPILAAGEMGVETNTNKFKFGNGTDTWSSLSYAAADAAGIGEISQDAINTALSMGAGLTKTYNDGANTITIAVDDAVIATVDYVDAAVSSVNSSLGDYIPVSDRGAQNGVASLNSSTKVPESELDLDGIALNINTSGTIDSPAISTAELVATDITSGGQIDANNVVISGNLTVSGTTTTVNTTNLSVTDPLIQVASDNNANSVDVGFVGHFNDGTSQHTGLVRDSSESKWKLFKGVTTSPTTNVDFTQGSLDDLAIGGLTASSASIGDVSNVELQYLNGVGSPIQTQINTVQSNIDTVVDTLADYAQLAAPTISNLTVIGTLTLPNSSIVAENIANASIGADKIIDGAIGPDKITNGTIADGKIASDAAIAQSKIANLTSDLALKADLAAPTFTGTVVLPTTTSIGSVSATEIGYLDGVTSAIQTQLNAKAASSVATDLSDHRSATTNVHGISDTSLLATKAYADQSESDAIDAAAVASENYTDAAVAALTKSSVGLGNVDNTSDANKPVSTATQTALDLKAPKAAPTFTGTLTAADVTISGNLTVSGTTTTVNTTNFTTSDPVIYLGDGNNANLVDIGFVGSYNDGTYAHQGLVKDASDGKWKLFKGVTDEPTTTVNFAQGSLDDIAVAALTATTVTPSSGVVFSDGTQTKEGVPSRTPIVQKTASYTLSSLTERDSMIEVASSSATTITIPANSSVAYPVGTSIDILQTSTGQVTIAAGAGVTVNATPGLKLRTQWSGATLFKRATDTWVVYGDLSA